MDAAPAPAIPEDREVARTAAIDRWFSLHAYDRHPDNYTASCQVFQYGDRGFMHSIVGRGFYENSREFLSLAERRGAATLEGYVTPAHARLMAGALRGVAEVRAAYRRRVFGREMVWTVVGRDPDLAALIAPAGRVL